MKPVFFLQSKRFWSMPVGTLVAWLIPKLASLGLEVPADDQAALTAWIIAGIVWFVGMAKGRRPVKLTPVKNTLGATTYNLPLLSVLAAVLLTVIVALPGCDLAKSLKQANAEAQTFEQRLFAAEGTFIVFQTAIVAALPALPDGKVKKGIQSAEAFAFTALEEAHEARLALKAGGDPGALEIGVIAAEGALDFLRHVLTREGMIGAGSSTGPPGDPALAVALPKEAGHVR